MLLTSPRWARRDPISPLRGRGLVSSVPRAPLEQQGVATGGTSGPPALARGGATTGCRRGAGGELRCPCTASQRPTAEIMSAPSRLICPGPGIKAMHESGTAGNQGGRRGRRGVGGASGTAPPCGGGGHGQGLRHRTPTKLHRLLARRAFH